MMRKVNPQFWRGKRVFITGHTGFKGGWMSLWLSSMGAQVCGYALPPPEGPSLFADAKIAQQVESVLADIRQSETLKRSVVNFAPEIVIHMAAQPLVRYSYANPIETYEVNVMGTLYLIESLRNLSSVQAVLNVTSDKCYENLEKDILYTEDSSLGGYDPYSNSKACSELATAAYRNSFYNEKGVFLSSARAGNVIGGGDWAHDRLIPDILRSLMMGDPIRIRNPQSIRPWQHVLEPLSGYLILLEEMFAKNQQTKGAFNFGPNPRDMQPVLSLVEKLKEKMGIQSEILIENQSQKHEAGILKLDSTKAQRILGWSPRWTLDETLESIGDWFHTYKYNPLKSFDKTLEQINKYNQS